MSICRLSSLKQFLLFLYYPLTYIGVCICVHSLIIATFQQNQQNLSSSRIQFFLAPYRMASNLSTAAVIASSAIFSLRKKYTFLSQNRVRQQFSNGYRLSNSKWPCSRIAASAKRRAKRDHVQLLHRVQQISSCYIVK